MSRTLFTVSVSAKSVAANLIVSADESVIAAFFSFRAETSSWAYIASWTAVLTLATDLEIKLRISNYSIEIVVNLVMA